MVLERKNEIRIYWPQSMTGAELKTKCKIVTDKIIFDIFIFLFYALCTVLSNSVCAVFDSFVLTF